MIITAARTSVSVFVFFVDDDSGGSPGEPTTGLLFSDIETGGSASYSRQGAARVDFELVTLASASASWTEGGFILVDDTNMPGLYRLDIPDAALVTGVDQVIIQLVAAVGKNTTMRPIVIDITDVDLRDAVRGGLTALPNVDAGSAGGLPDDTDANGAVRIVDGAGARELNTNSGAVALVDLVTTTTTNTDMRGTDDAALIADYTAARAVFLDNLDISENVAGTSEVAHLVSAAGTSDSGTTATMVDSVRTEIDDHWNGGAIVFGSGGSANNVGVTRLITDFDAGSDTLTFAPVVLTGITTETYTIIPKATVELLAATQTSIDQIEIDTNSLNNTKIPNTLNTTALGNIGVDWANVENPATAVDLAGTDIQLVDTCTANSDMRGTDSAALANVLGALTDAAAVGDPTTADTLMQYVKQLLNVLVGTTGVGVYPAEQPPGNGVNLFEVISAIHADVTDITLPGQEAPPLSPTLAEAVGWLYKVMRNRTEQTATTWSLMADNETTQDAKATVSDDSTTAIKEEIVAGT